MLTIDPKLPEAKGIGGLLLTLSSQNGSEKAKQIESVAKSNNNKYSVVVRGGVHNASDVSAFPNHPPTATGPWWFGIELTAGDDTPETIHIYVDPVDPKLLMLLKPGPGPGNISVENKLQPGLTWY
jgi:hypothetical protein